MDAKGTALPGSCSQGGGGDGGCSPLLFPALSDSRWGQEIHFHWSPRPAPWDTRVPSCLAPPSRGQHSPHLCLCSAQCHPPP